MKLLFQSDDFGITKAVTLGIVEGIEKGVIRNTGLFTNMESSAFAASLIPNYPQCCFGVDVNFVAGYPLSDPKDVPSLVDENGRFISSIRRYQEGKVVSTNGISTVFEVEPYVYEEVYAEMEKQIQKYIELVGKKPEYLHPHSLITPAIEKAFSVLAEKYELKLSYQWWEKFGLFSIPANWNIKPVFSIDAQRDTNVVEKVMAVIDQALEHDRALLICHAGYVDAPLLNVSSYSLIRARDLEMAQSDQLKAFIDEYQVELITYRELNDDCL